MLGSFIDVRYGMNASFIFYSADVFSERIVCIVYKWGVDSFYAHNFLIKQDERKMKIKKKD